MAYAMTIWHTCKRLVHMHTLCRSTRYIVIREQKRHVRVGVTAIYTGVRAADTTRAEEPRTYGDGFGGCDILLIYRIGMRKLLVRTT